MSTNPTRPPGPRRRAFFGVLREYRKNPAEFLERTARQYGDLVYLRLGPHRVYLPSHPETIKDILVTNQAQFTKSRMLERARMVVGDGLLTSEGDFHKRQRRLVQPAFHRERLAAYAAIMSEGSAQCCERWEPGEHLDISGEMMRLTMTVVARALFGANVESEADEIGAALTEVFGLFEVILLPFSEWIEKLPLPAFRRFYRARERMDATIYRMIAERRSRVGANGDLLSMLLAASDEDDGGIMTDKQVRDEVLTIFLAGHETTTVAATWAWYLLSQNPQAEGRFHAEIDHVLGGRLPGLDDLPRLRYTEGVFAETMRLYPPVWAIGRRALRNYPVGDYTIPSGATVLMCPYAVHRDPRWFSDPTRFIPERWLREDNTRPKFSYFPFGGGARVCIGDRFAWTEGILLLATIGRCWRFRLEPGHRVETRPLITLRTRYGMRMIAEPRGPARQKPDTSHGSSSS